MTDTPALTAQATAELAVMTPTQFMLQTSTPSNADAPAINGVIIVVKLIVPSLWSRTVSF
jgi:hypothetical protein